MIEVLRIDDRLLHGQVVMKWLNMYSPDAIVVADDEASTNEIQKVALKMAKPNGMSLAIRSVDDAIDLINHEQTQNMKLFVVVRTTEGARRIVEKTSKTNIVNVGGMSAKKEGTKMVISGVHMTDSDIENILIIDHHVNEIDTRVVPTSKKKRFADCI